jgi:hypothetical protein
VVKVWNKQKLRDGAFTCHVGTWALSRQSRHFPLKHRLFWISFSQHIRQSRSYQQQFEDPGLGTTRIRPQFKMAFRYPNGYFNGYPRGILRPRNRARQPSDDDRYGHVDIYPDVYFDGLCLNPRLGQMVWDTGDEASYTPRTRGYGPRFQDPTAEQFLATPRMGSRARQDQHLRDSGMVSRRRSDENVERSGRPDILRDPVLPFGLAMKELHRKLEAAEKFYESFESEYEDDIKSIKAYAAKEILEKLWTRKVRGSNAPQAASTNQDGYNDGDFAEYGGKFAAFRGTVRHALDEAMNSRLGDGAHDLQSGTRYNSMCRLVEKIETANRQILPLLDGASKGQDACKVLIEELQQLKSLVDPENEKTKHIFKDGDYGQAENHSGMADSNQPWQGLSAEWGG